MMRYVMLAWLFSNVALAAEDYLTAKHPPSAEWGYPGQKDKRLPDQWAPACDVTKEHQHQSPIDLQKKLATSAKSRLEVSYVPTKFSVYHNRHTVELDDKSPGKNTVVFDGKKFVLKQFHYHRPAEHLLDGKELDFETHFVHSDGQGNFLVLGVLGEFVTREKSGLRAHREALRSPFGNELTRILDGYQGAGEPNVAVDIDEVELTALLPSNQKSFFTYKGSLTTPPCSENVTWVVFTHPVRMTQNQRESIIARKFGIGFQNARRHERAPFPHLPPFNAKGHDLKFVAQ